MSHSPERIAMPIALQPSGRQRRPSARIAVARASPSSRRIAGTPTNTRAIVPPTRRSPRGDARCAAWSACPGRLSGTRASDVLRPSPGRSRAIRGFRPRTTTGPPPGNRDRPSDTGVAARLAAQPAPQILRFPESDVQSSRQRVDGRRDPPAIHGHGVPPTARPGTGPTPTASPACGTRSTRGA